jgi:hypothetical protein
MLRAVIRRIRVLTGPTIHTRVKVTRHRRILRMGGLFVCRELVHGHPSRRRDVAEARISGKTSYNRRSNKPNRCWSTTAFRKETGDEDSLDHLLCQT